MTAAPHGWSAVADRRCVVAPLGADVAAVRLPIDTAVLRAQAKAGVRRIDCAPCASVLSESEVDE
ncbi:MAG: hypothetical protein J0L57_08770 [Burkholderiales bacterium]|nr:hypothetical protein [Burkholderiales bacterium]